MSAEQAVVDYHRLAAWAERAERARDEAMRRAASRMAQDGLTGRQAALALGMPHTTFKRRLGAPYVRPRPEPPPRDPGIPRCRGERPIAPTGIHYDEQ